MRQSVRLVLVIGLALLSCIPAFAATRTWTGAADTLWSNAGNWDALPAAGDDLVFPDAAGNKTNTNDLPAGTSFASITLNDGYAITGNSITLTGTLLNAAGTSMFSPPIILGGNVTIEAVTATQLDLFSTIDLGANILTFDLDDSGRIDANGVISGAGSIVRISTTNSGERGHLFFAGTNTYTGITTLDAGYNFLANSSALGSTAAGTTVNPAVTLRINGIAFGAEPITISSTGTNGNGGFQSSGVSSIAGPVSLAGLTSVNVLPGQILEFLGPVSGDFEFMVHNEGTVIFTNSGNTFGGPLTFGNPGTTVRLGASNVLPDSLVATMNAATHTLDVNGFTDTIASISGPGTVALGAGSLTLANGASNFSGAITGTGALTITAGTHTLSGTSTYTGPTTITGGELNVSGTLVSDVTVNAGTLRLLNGGSIGALTATGGIPGVTGVATTGNVNLGAGSIATFVATGAGPGQFGSIVATGTVTLGSQFVFSTGFAFPIGTQLTLISNDGADPIAGTFAGLPEGAMFDDGTNTWTISYVGGDGNDIVITAAPLALVATTTTLTTSPNPSTFGQLVTFTATVTGAGGTPTGTVSFFDGVTLLGTSPLNGAGVATFTTTTLTEGDHLVNAVYSGDATFATSTSVRITHTVNPAIVAVPVPFLGGFGIVVLVGLLALAGMRLVRA